MVVARTTLIDVLVGLMFAVSGTYSPASFLKTAKRIGEKAMLQKVLIITRQEDKHVDIIAEKLKEKGVFVYRIDTDREDVRGVTFSCSQKKGVKFLFCDPESGQSVDLRTINSVWFRKPTGPKRVYDPGTPREISKYIDNETKEWMKSICCVLEEAFWVNHPLSLQRANRKLSQLITARSLDLKIPDTIISDDSKQIKELFSNHQEGVVAKTFRTQFVTSEDGTCYLPRTQEISKEDLDNPSFYSYPCIVQEKIRRSFEVRSIVIGDEIFSFGIKPRHTGCHLDIRSLDLRELNHFVYDLSWETKEKILKLVRHYKLHFSALDLLVTSDGEEVFLELNPNGQWLWLEILTGVIMSETFCDLLLQKK